MWIIRSAVFDTSCSFRAPYVSKENICEQDETKNNSH